jgi:hypothetical protein
MGAEAAADFADWLDRSTASITARLSSCSAVYPLSDFECEHHSSTQLRASAMSLSSITRFTRSALFAWSSRDVLSCPSKAVSGGALRRHRTSNMNGEMIPMNNAAANVNAQEQTRSHRKVRARVDYVEDLTIALLVTEAYRFGAQQGDELKEGIVTSAKARYAIRVHVALKDASHDLTVTQRNHLSIVAHLAAGLTE